VDAGATQTFTGKVSASGVIGLPNVKGFKVKFVKSGTTVLGFQGTFTNTGADTSGVILGLRQT
jgi:hypothetical protein